MSTIKSSDEHLTLNADGSSKDIKFQANGVEKASISSAGAFTSTTIDATKLTGNLPAVSGASLTALNATNLGSGTVPTARLGSGTASSSTFLRGDGSWQSAGGDNTPSFKAVNNSAQSIPHVTNTKLIFDTEVWDTDNAYASNKFTVPSGKDGVYIFNWHFILAGMDSGEYVNTQLYVNGSSEMQSYTLFYSANNDAGMGTTGTVILDLDAGDYVEAYIQQVEGSAQDTYSNTNYFSGYRLIGV